MGKTKHQKKVQPLPKPDPQLQKELDEALNVDMVEEQIAKFPRGEKQRLEMLVDGLFLFAPEDFLNGVEGEESDSEITARHLEEKFKPKKSLSENEPNIKEKAPIAKNNENTDEQESNVAITEQKAKVEAAIVEKNQPPAPPAQQLLKFPPKFHLEPVPAEFLPENADPEKLSPEEFKDRFQRMREYMTARRKAINQDEKRKRREERRSKKKTKTNNTPITINAQVKKAEQSKPVTAGPLIMTKIVKEEKVKKAGATPKQALEKLKQEQEKVETLKKEDPEAAQELLKKSTLKRALAKARGESVKDDSRKLKRTIQRTEKEKQKSEKAWREKKTKLKYAQKMRVEKREKNIKQRIEKIKSEKQQRKRR